MSTNAIISIEGTDHVYWLSSDGYPAYVVPNIRAAYVDAYKFDALFKEFARLMPDGKETTNKGMCAANFDHRYIILQDGRLVIDSMHIVNLS